MSDPVDVLRRWHGEKLIRQGEETIYLNAEVKLERVDVRYL
jgi:hypothetical protein